jgi:Zn-dependent peptidase ImmA (M78 family)
VDGRVDVEFEREANAFSVALLMSLDDFRTNRWIVTCVDAMNARDGKWLTTAAWC